CVGRKMGVSPARSERPVRRPSSVLNGERGEVPMESRDDYLIFRPLDVDLRRSPLRRSLDAPTHVLGAFNPGLARLPNGNLLIMVRVAEALSEPVKDGHVQAIRWTADGYVLDRHPLAS